MIKRWDTRLYDIKLILEVFDSLSLDLRSINAPKPKVYDLETIIKALLIKEFEGHSLRSAEVRIKEVLGIRIDHSVLHFWEKNLSSTIEEILNKVLERLQSIDYTDSFIDSTKFANKKRIS
ncbi:MAG: hypothetical protein H5T42_09020 [Methanothrix sp.]|uniref:hypothetical protein n=1 Tax=Methanothrix sp. TaxID=90426 RepID=UPI0019C1486C|nr:hypothetical protein [Methanothrix sp.]MBC7080580.1 hypothetical protein [Methanothrix sp.]NPU86918.1 hypothetical protein [Methanothrix sp.]HOK58245.1 hypothetical protein [Methanothrix sp.]HOK59223.1 hypothetical protein [Methanothrix sp.]HOL43569.1 hypothetical protein [Methanothrix sp.]